MTDLEAIVAGIAETMADRTDRGKVANYIPQLAQIDPAQFGIAVALPDGRMISAGDSTAPFSIQSISKAFTLAIALGRLGDHLWTRVGREPSGNPYNSILQLEHENGRPRNPFINAGAIAVTDAILSGQTPKSLLGELLLFIRTAADDDDIHINQSVASVRDRHRRPQLCAGLFHARPRQAAQSGRDDAGHLFPPMRHRDELSAAGPRRVCS